MTIINSPSPNFDSRGNYKPEMIVVHCTDGTYPYDLQYLQNPHPGSVVGPVSAHFLIAPSGAVHQLVDTTNRAWHAGRIDHPTATLKKDAGGNYINPNYYTIGIETSMVATEQITPVQEDALLALIVQLTRQFNIPFDRAHVVGHHEIYSLKTCPGTINLDALLAAPASATEQQLIQEVSDLLPRVNALPEPARTQARGTLSRIVAAIVALFSGK